MVSVTQRMERVTVVLTDTVDQHVTKVIGLFIEKILQNNVEKLSDISNIK